MARRSGRSMGSNGLPSGWKPRFSQVSSALTSPATVCTSPAACSFAATTLPDSASAITMAAGIWSSTASSRASASFFSCATASSSAVRRATRRSSSMLADRTRSTSACRSLTSRTSQRSPTSVSWRSRIADTVTAAAKTEWSARSNERSQSLTSSSVARRSSMIRNALRSERASSVVSGFPIRNSRLRPSRRSAARFASRTVPRGSVTRYESGAHSKRSR